MPPIGYPGNSISKEARAKAGGGFESAMEAVEPPPVSNADFSFFENFEGLNKDVSFADSYNASVSLASPITFRENTGEGPAGRTIVSLNDPIIGLPQSPPNPPSNPKIDAASPGSGRTGNGTNCAMLFFYVGKAANQSGVSEQRWMMNPDFLGSAAGLSEFWMQYDEYIPANFVHRLSEVIDAGRKVLAFYADHYSFNDPADGNADPTMIVGAQSYIPDGATVRGSELDFSYFVPGIPDPSVTHYNLYGRRSGVAPEDLILIHPDIDRGHWQRRTLHVRLPTAVDSNDGLIEFWVQRQAEAASPPAPEKLANWTGGDYYAENQNYLNKGYLMGFANAGFSEDTTFLITNLILSSSVNDVDQTAIN